MIQEYLRSPEISCPLYLPYKFLCIFLQSVLHLPVHIHEILHLLSTKKLSYFPHHIDDLSHLTLIKSSYPAL